MFTTIFWNRGNTPERSTHPIKLIIIETSTSDHNIIQIEANLKIVEEEQNHQIKESNLSYRDLNFCNEDISWASIVADLFSTINWDILFTDVNPYAWNV